MITQPRTLYPCIAYTSRGEMPVKHSINRIKVKIHPCIRRYGMNFLLGSIGYVSAKVGIVELFNKTCVSRTHIYFLAVSSSHLILISKIKNETRLWRIQQKYISRFHEKNCWCSRLASPYLHSNSGNAIVIWVQRVLSANVRNVEVYIEHIFRLLISEDTLHPYY